MCSPGTIDDVLAVDIFTVSGTWRKPPQAVTIEVVLISPGLAVIVSYSQEVADPRLGLLIARGFRRRLQKPEEMM